MQKRNDALPVHAGLRKDKAALASFPVQKNVPAQLISVQAFQKMVEIADDRLPQPIFRPNGRMRRFAVSKLSNARAHGLYGNASHAREFDL
jgi:hypothetical protein